MHDIHIKPILGTKELLKAIHTCRARKPCLGQEACNSSELSFHHLGANCWMVNFKDRHKVPSLMFVIFKLDFGWTALQTELSLNQKERTIFCKRGHVTTPAEEYSISTFSLFHGMLNSRHALACF